MISSQLTELRKFIRSVPVEEVKFFIDLSHTGFCSENIYDRQVNSVTVILVGKRTKSHFNTIYTSSESDFFDIVDLVPTSDMMKSIQENVCLQTSSVHGVKRGTFVLVDVGKNKVRIRRTVPIRT